MWAFGNSQPDTALDQEDFTFLGKDVVFKGSLTLHGSVRVDGQFEGELHSTGTLTVGEHATVRGNIVTGILITSGMIKGDIIASEQVTILRQGVVIGDIRTPAISIEAGAHFHGLSDMGTDTWPDRRNTANEKVQNLTPKREKLRLSDQREN
ncbi:MAG: polymer-forming cytoskeletal protein [Nitrospira sp.]|nr:polymer-forming cytoskeletal protein [Nitrospira sp.]